ncbi:MAG: outer membrane lipoprotein carrier protein LolA [Chitinophagaceae bacterium]|nr:outer membrane lipoprotein carrier protein LolA [Chitinophagaceae bacterium]
MKSIVAFLSIILLQNLAIAQNDPNAKKILDAVGQKVNSFKSISGNFTIKSFTSKGKPNGVKTGTISMKGSKYVLKQGKTEITCDGKNIYSFDGSKTITVGPAEDANKSLTPQKILSGSYDKEFNYKLISSKGAFHEIELKPVDTRKNFQKVTVFVDKTKNIISKAKVLDKSNNTMEFSFTNLNTSSSIADNVFVFNKNKYPKDVEILD